MTEKEIIQQAVAFMAAVANGDRDQMQAIIEHVQADGQVSTLLLRVTELGIKFYEQAHPGKAAESLTLAAIDPEFWERSS